MSQLRAKSMQPAALSTRAIVFAGPLCLGVETLDIAQPGAGDVIVDIDWSGISTGTERLLWSGAMPAFPGMGYPLVPGYESVGRIVAAGGASGRQAGDTVFVAGANCYGAVRGLFGGAAERVVVPGARALPVDAALGADATLLALAATAYHAIGVDAAPPELIVGHGVLGRLLARLARLAGGDPVVWETNPARQGGAEGYTVLHPDEDSRRDYNVICDVSGDAGLLNALIARLAPGGEIILAGFYAEPLSFAFPPAFMREARLRVAAQWQPADLIAVRDLVARRRLSLAGLITHSQPAATAATAYPTAFDDPDCLKMILDWRAC